MNRILWAALVVLLLSRGPASAQGRMFFGADLDGGTQAEGIGVDMQDTHGYKSKNVKATDPNKLCDIIGKQFGADPVTHKLPCNGGLLFVYIAAHGGAGDPAGDDGYMVSVVNGQKKWIKDNDLAKCIAEMIPPCCVLVFTMDCCGTNAWWDNYLNNPARNPFRGINFIAAVADVPGLTCPESPVRKKISAGISQGAMTAEQYCEYLKKRDALTPRNLLVKSVCNFTDDAHKNRLVQVPEPTSMAVLAGGAGLLIWRRRNRASSK